MVPHHGINPEDLKIGDKVSLIYRNNGHEAPFSGVITHISPYKQRSKGGKEWVMCNVNHQLSPTRSITQSIPSHRLIRGTRSMTYEEYYHIQKLKKGT